MMGRFFIEMCKLLFATKPPPLLGRWCRVDTHVKCRPCTKADWANIDNSL